MFLQLVFIYKDLILCRIVVPEYGLMHLELIPMLVGFFTYKIATFTQAIEEALTIVGNREEDSSTT